jgi:hypothetical protein
MNRWGTRGRWAEPLGTRFGPETRGWTQRSTQPGLDAGSLVRYGWMQGILVAEDKFKERQAEGVADLAQFREVKQFLARLKSAHKWLWLGKALSEIRLAQASFGPNVPQEILQDFLFVGKNALLHGRIIGGKEIIYSIPLLSTNDLCSWLAERPNWLEQWLWRSGAYAVGPPIRYLPL